jgi:Apea-like HEPN
MVSIVAGSGTKVRIFGHGLTVREDFALAPGLTVSSTTAGIADSFGSRGIGELQTQVAVLAMERLANFSLLIEEPGGGEALAIKAWNALWVFSLLALTCRSPVMPLYSAPDGSSRFTLANRNIVINLLPKIVAADGDQLQWAADHYARFNALLQNERFQSAQRYYNNAHYLFDNDAKIMLLWAGIEGLLDVQAELRQRIALHAAILFDGDAAAKATHFTNVRKAYDIRSKVVHGSGTDAKLLSSAYEFASEVLVGLLRKSVELGRVPAGSELDRLAAGVTLS